MKRYTRLVRRTGANWAPLGATVTREVSTTQLTKSIINCFGLSVVSAEVALEALNTNVWSTFKGDIQLALSEMFHLIGLSCTGLAVGAPIWLVTGSINSSYVVPTTCRLFLIMACDLTLVLARSFKEVGARGQPSEKDVSTAARNYAVRGYSQHVHRDIKKLIPRSNVLASFKVEMVQRGIEELIGEYKNGLIDDIDLPLHVQGVRIESRTWDDTNTKADSTVFEDAMDANVALAELEASVPYQIVELDATKPIVKLSADNVPRVGLEG